MVTPRKPCLVFGDLHIPYQHEHALEFLCETYNKYDCGSVACTGDLCDFHAMSRHVTELDSLSPNEEYAKMLDLTAELTRIFPKAKLVLGNHCQIPQRQMKEIGLSTAMLRSYNDLYGLGKGWKIDPLYHTIFDGEVLVEHGIGSGGMYGCINTAIAKRTSYVQGHTHSYAMVAYRSNYKSTIFGMNTGCLFNSNSLAARYGVHSKWKGVLGCGVVYAPDHAEFIPMRGK